jgi:hypothetical protein
MWFLRLTVLRNMWLSKELSVFIFFPLTRHQHSASSLTHFLDWFMHKGADGTVDCWCTMAQAGRSRVRVKTRSLCTVSSCTVALGFTHHLTEMSARTSWGWSTAGWQLYRHLWAGCLENLGSSTSHSLVALLLYLISNVLYWFYNLEYLKCHS